jgi:branched-chain amino acid transport system permease protein
MFKNTKNSTILFMGGSLLVFLVVQVLISTGTLSTFWLTLLRVGAVMAIVSLGLNLIYGFNGQFSLGQWGFYAIGAYAAADITWHWHNNRSSIALVIVLLGTVFAALAIISLRRFFSRIRGLDALSAFAIYLVVIASLTYVAVLLGGILEPAVSGLLMALPANVSTQIVFLFAVVLAGILAAEISFLFGLPVLTLGSDYFGIATLGFTIIVKVLLDNSDTMFGFAEMKGARGMIGIPKMTSWFWVFLFLFLVVLITRNLLQSSYGRAIVSVREDEIAAKAMGIDVAHYKNLTFVLGSLFAGLAGALYAHINGFLHPNEFNFIKSFDPMIIVVFGGLGSVSGTIVASFAWALVLEGFLRLWLPTGFETWRFVVYPVLLLLIMLLKPKGLFGDFEFPFLRQLIPPLSPTAASRKQVEGQGRPLTDTLEAPGGNPTTPNPSPPSDPIPPHEATQ